MTRVRYVGPWADKHSVTLKLGVLQINTQHTKRINNQHAYIDATWQRAEQLETWYVEEEQNPCCSTAFPALVCARHSLHLLLLRERRQMLVPPHFLRARALIIWCLCSHICDLQPCTCSCSSSGSRHSTPRTPYSGSKGREPIDLLPKRQKKNSHSDHFFLKKGALNIVLKVDKIFKSNKKWQVPPIGPDKRIDAKLSPRRGGLLFGGMQWLTICQCHSFYLPLPLILQWKERWCGKQLDDVPQAQDHDLQKLQHTLPLTNYHSYFRPV